jgi:hypothetical protein
MTPAVKKNKAKPPITISSSGIPAEAARRRKIQRAIAKMVLPPGIQGVPICCLSSPRAWFLIYTLLICHDQSEGEVLQILSDSWLGEGDGGRGRQFSEITSADNSPRKSYGKDFRNLPAC